MGKVRIVCAWCGDLMRVEEWEGQTGTSHGICAECATKEKTKELTVEAIRRNDKRIPEIIAAAKNVMVFSLSSHFTGRPMAEGPIDPDAWPREAKHITQQEFLAKEYRLYRFARITREGSKYKLHIHSNLWYEFEN